MASTAVGLLRETFANRGLDINVVCDKLHSQSFDGVSLHGKFPYTRQFLGKLFTDVCFTAAHIWKANASVHLDVIPYLALFCECVLLPTADAVFAPHLRNFIRLSLVWALYWVLKHSGADEISSDWKSQVALLHTTVPVWCSVWFAFWLWVLVLNWDFMFALTYCRLVHILLHIFEFEFEFAHEPAEPQLCVFSTVVRLGFICRTIFGRLHIIFSWSTEMVCLKNDYREIYFWDTWISNW